MELRRENLEKERIEAVEPLQILRPFGPAPSLCAPAHKCDDLQLRHLSLHSVALAPGLGRGSAPPADQQYAQQHSVKRGAISAFRNHGAGGGGGGAAGVSLTDNALHQARPRHRTDRVGEAEDDFSRAA